MGKIKYIVKEINKPSKEAKASLNDSISVLISKKLIKKKMN